MVWFFHISADWRRYDNEAVLKTIMEASAFFACFLFIVLSLRRFRNQHKYDAAILDITELLPSFIVLGYELVLHPSNFIPLAIIVCAITGSFSYLIFKVLGINRPRKRELYLKRLLRRTKSFIYCSIALLTILSVLIGLSIDVVYPYARDRIKIHAEQVRYESVCSNLKTEIWKELDVEGRVEVLKAIMDYEATFLEMGTVDIMVDDLNRISDGWTYTQAQYDESAYWITIDEKLINEGYVTDALDAVFHEFRHFQQHFYADSRRDPYLYLGFDTNFKDYKDSDFDGFGACYHQLVEVDARNWAIEKINDYIEYFSPEDFESSELYRHYSGRFAFYIKTEGSNEPWDYISCHNYKLGDSNSNDYIILKKYKGLNTVKRIEIPAYIDNLPVIELESGLFENAEDFLEEIYISENLQYVDRALDDCLNLSLIISSDNEYLLMVDGLKLVNSYGSLIWVDKKAKGKLFLSEDIAYIEPLSFRNCKDITDIIIAENSNYYYSFEGIVYDKATGWLTVCPEGKAGVVNVADGCTEINNSCFYGCDRITEINIPSSLKGIYTQPFVGCNLIRSMVIPPTVEKLSIWAFDGMASLETLKVSKATKIVGVLVDSDLAITFSLKIEKESNLKDIYYDGTWQEASEYFINKKESPVVIHCTDGNYELTDYY